MSKNKNKRSTKKVDKKIVTQALLVAATVSAATHVTAEEAKANPQAQTNEPAVKSTAQQKGQVINVQTNLRMRTSPSTSSAIVSYLVNGKEFNIVGKSGDWYNIQADGKNGYVHKDYVKEIGTSSNGSQSFNKKGRVINVSYKLNLRRSATTSSQVVAYLDNGQEFNIKSKEGAWHKVEVNGVEGYLYEEYVQVIGNVTPANPPAAPSNNAASANNTQNTPSNTQQLQEKGQVVNVPSGLRLRLRKANNTSSAILDYLDNGQSFDIIGKSGEWYNISVKGISGYVYKDYVKVAQGNVTVQATPAVTQEDKVGTVVVTGENLRFRSEPSTNSAVLGYFMNGQSVRIIGTSGDWYKINYNGKIGYAHKNYIRLVNASSSHNTTNASTSSSSQSSASYEAVVNIMKAQIGAPYVWGGSGELLTTQSLNTIKNRFPQETQSGSYNLAQQYVNKGFRSFDCSGLMYWGFKQVGVNLGRTTYDQIRNGVEVSINSLRPGDLLFYGDLTHVGMYIGNNQWIEAPNSRSFVKVTTVPWNKVTRARRVIN